MPKSKPRRYLVACQPLTAEGDDCRGIRCRPAPQLDCRGDDFRNAHDIGLHYVGMLQQDLLDLERCEVDAADLDHLLQPAAKSDPPVLLGRGTDGSNPSPSSGESAANSVRNCKRYSFGEWSRLAMDQDWDLGMREYLDRLASEDDGRDAVTAVRGHYDKVTAL